MKYKEGDIVLLGDSGYSFCPCIMEITVVNAKMDYYKGLILDTEDEQYRPDSGSCFSNKAWAYLECELWAKVGEAKYCKAAKKQGKG